MPDNRKRIGFWTFRTGFTVVVFGFGIALGPNLKKSQLDLRPIKLFKTSAYKGFKA